MRQIASDSRAVPAARGLHITGVSTARSATMPRCPLERITAQSSCFVLAAALEWAVALSDNLTVRGSGRKRCNMQRLHTSTSITYIACACFCLQCTVIQVSHTHSACNRLPPQGRRLSEHVRSVPEIFYFLGLPPITHRFAESPTWPRETNALRVLMRSMAVEH